jgi:hypothetical protein
MVVVEKTIDGVERDSSTLGVIGVAAWTTTRLYLAYFRLRLRPDIFGPLFARLRSR